MLWLFLLSSTTTFARKGKASKDETIKTICKKKYSRDKRCRTTTKKGVLYVVLLLVGCAVGSNKSTATRRSRQRGGLFWANLRPPMQKEKKAARELRSPGALCSALDVRSFFTYGRPTQSISSVGGACLCLSRSKGPKLDTRLSRRRPIGLNGALSDTCPHRNSLTKDLL